MSKYLHQLYKNPLSRFTGIMAVMVFAIMAALLLLDYLDIKLNPIIGILAYTLFPGLLIFYIFLFILGMYREWKRRHREEGLKAPEFPRFDFNIKHQRTLLYVFILGFSLVGLLVLAVAYRAYEFTDTVTFCSDICHKVMLPEATTYKNSPHARVACVQCHVGGGATWYVRSKLSGLYQVYATLFNKYPRPIETPIVNLRPSKDTCEQCHWPPKFYGARQILSTIYEDDEKNTPHKSFMLLNIGGGISPTGIHWHVGNDEVFYIARDKKRQDIPWIKVKYEDGREALYVDGDNPLSSEELAKATPRKMDCMDCHNRPTHIFHPPHDALNRSLSAGLIDSSLPYIKKLGMDVLSKDYPEETVKSAIHDAVFSFYTEKYPEIAKDKALLLEKTSEEFQKIWAQNNYPHMKSNWSTYPDNIGHLMWPGCFRCHDNRHKNESGDVIKKDCNVCHVFLSEKLSEEVTAAASLGKPFKHPVDVGGEEMKMPCNSCHQN